MNRAAAAGILLVLIVLPAVSPSHFYINIATEVVIAAILASSYNLLLGFGGILSLCHATFYGVGAYVLAISVVKFGWPGALAIPLALSASVGLSAVLSPLILRTGGLSLMMTTLAIGQLLWGVAVRWVGMTGGDSGLAGLTRPSLLGFDLNAPSNFFYLTLAVGCLAVWLIVSFIESPFGQCLRGVRDQPKRMEAFGHNVWAVRYLTIVYASFWAAVAGVLFAYQQRFVSPYSLGVDQQLAPLIMVILGGLGTYVGPILGALIVVLVERVLSSYVQIWPTILGLAFIATVMFAPAGLSKLISDRWRVGSPKPAGDVKSAGARRTA